MVIVEPNPVKDITGKQNAIAFFSSSQMLLKHRSLLMLGVYKIVYTQCQLRFIPSLGLGSELTLN